MSISVYIWHSHASCRVRDKTALMCKHTVQQQEVRDINFGTSIGLLVHKGRNCTIMCHAMILSLLRGMASVLGAFSFWLKTQSHKKVYMHCWP